MLAWLRAGATGPVSVARNPNLRQLQFALASVSFGEAAFTVALAVYAYGVGGATAVGIVGLVCLVPSAVTVPLGAWFGDRHERERVLVALALTSAAVLGGCTVAFYYLDRSETAIFALAAAQAALASLIWPVASALAPSLATTPTELIAANAASSTVDGLGTLAGPLAAGILIATTSPGVVFGLAAGAFLWAAAMVATIRVEGRIRLGADPGHELLAGLRLLVRDRRVATVSGLFCAQAFVRGLVNVLVVVTSFRLLHASDSWVGYLTAAIGLGGLVGGLGSATLAAARLWRGGAWPGRLRSGSWPGASRSRCLPPFRIARPRCSCWQPWASAMPSRTSPARRCSNGWSTTRCSRGWPVSPTASPWRSRAWARSSPLR